MQAKLPQEPESQPEASAEESLAQQLWDELSALQDGQVTPWNAPGQWLDAIPRRVRRGELPSGIFEVDGKVALRRYNRAILLDLLGRARRLMGRHPVRWAGPRVSSDTKTPNARPGAARVWSLFATDSASAEAHARLSISAHLETAARLHGAALVEMGICTWDDIEQDGHLQWTNLCRRLREP